jgi:uncharacterized protein YraI
MQNKANFGNDTMNITLDMTSNYEISSRRLRQKNKANSNPIKPKTNPIQSQFKPKQSQFKHNFNNYLMLKPMVFLKSLFKKSLSVLSASQRFAVDKSIRKRRSMRIKKLTVSRLVANLMQRRVIWRFSCFFIWGIGTCFLGDRKMQSYKKLFVIIILTSLVSIGFAQTTTSSSDTADTLSFPYMAEITGDNVYVRSGPGTNFYDCSKLNTGDKVKVIGKQFSWARIVPPPGSFSWISIQYVNIDPANPTVGTVTGDRVRVYAGSDHVEPLHSTYLQGKLDRGDKVKLLGEQKGDYYKIAPLSFAYLWVSTNFTKPLPAEPVETPIPIVKPTEVKPTEVKPTEVKPTTVPKEVPKEVVVPPEPDTPETLLEKYRALQKQVEAERIKPIEKQNYTEIKKALIEIAENKTAGNAARYAQSVLKLIKDLELVLAVGKEVRLQDEQLKNIRERIVKTRTTKLAKLKNLDNFAVVGKLKNFMTYGPGHYRIVDDSGKTICYALPSAPISQAELSKLIDKKVGLVGTIEPHRQTKGALIRFTKIMEVE